MKGSEVVLRWRHPVTDDELFQLTAAHGGRATRGWWDQVRPHSLGWATARLADGALLGFANIAWDGGDHAFPPDTKTRPDNQHLGIGTAVVRLAAHRARDAGCEWLHVDFDRLHRSFYLDACGLRGTEDAGLILLYELQPEQRP